MTSLWRAVLLLLAIPALASCASTGTSSHAHSGDWPEATPFDPEADARSALQLTLAAAAVEDAAGQGQSVHVLAIFGANWCHDSRALAGSPVCLPYSRYMNYWGEPWGKDTAFVHFVGSHRYDKGAYADASLEAIAEMGG